MDFYVIFVIIVGFMLLTSPALIVLTIIFYRKAQRVCHLEEKEAVSIQKEEQSMLPILNVIGLEMIVFNGLAAIVLFIVSCICVPLLVWSIVTISKINKRKRARKEQDMAEFYITQGIILFFLISASIALIIITSIFYKKAKRAEREEVKELQLIEEKKEQDENY